jgi:hypothetical protein
LASGLDALIRANDETFDAIRHHIDEAGYRGLVSGRSRDKELLR